MTTEILGRRFYRNHGDVGDGKGYSRKLSLKLLFEPRDLWVGLYWKREGREHLFLYVCPIPTLCLRIHIARSWGGRYV